MAKVVGKNIFDRGIYQATELAGKNFVSLRLIDQLPDPDPEVIKVEISKKLARRVGAAKNPGETLSAAIERLIRDSL
jgi:hypothetical protein